MTETHPRAFAGDIPSPAWAFDQYELIRPFLPEAAATSAMPKRISSLMPLTEHFDAFVFDAFGVLNVGPKVIPGAVERLAELQARGKCVLVLSNAATADHPALTAKYRGMGFHLATQQVISSRWLLEESLRREPCAGTWGVIAPEQSRPESLPLSQQPVRSGTPDDVMDALDGFIFLSSEGWNEDLQGRLLASLSRRQRPLVVANPDLVAPRGDCLTLEPGYFCHLIRQALDIAPVFFGKPYAPAFDAVKTRLVGIRPERILMVGDTLHTDILGGRAAGMATLLVTEHGSLQGLDYMRLIQASGISPDYIAPAI